MSDKFITVTTYPKQMPELVNALVGLGINVEQAETFVTEQGETKISLTLWVPPDRIERFYRTVAAHMDSPKE